MIQEEIRRLPHKVVDGIAILLTDQETIEHTAEQPESEKIFNLRKSIISKCKEYLAETDWQVIRLADPTSREPLKEGVAEKRGQARDFQIIAMKENATLEELQNLNSILEQNAN